MIQFSTLDILSLTPKFNQYIEEMKPTTTTLINNRTKTTNNEIPRNELLTSTPIFNGSFEG